MILSDSIELREEAILYAMGLAGRLNAFVVLLLLLDLPEQNGVSDDYETVENIKKRSREKFSQYLKRFDDEGLHAEVWVKVGDFASEFIKFLAGTGSFQTIVWGGSEAKAGAGSNSLKKCWLGKLKGLVECPLVVPSKR